MLSLKYLRPDPFQEMCNVQCSEKDSGKKLSLQARVIRWIFHKRKRASCFGSCRASVTVEASLVSGTEGTTILNYGNESEKEDGKICHPMLRDMELGIIYVIKNCPFYIGSAEGVNHLHIQDKTVSREHAVILEDIYEGDGQGYILRDMGSTNGTWLNGKKIKRGNQEQLEDGAVIRFAKKEYEFLIQDI